MHMACRPGLTAGRERARLPRWGGRPTARGRPCEADSGTLARTPMQSDPNTAQTPFRIDVADRVKRLPPYLFGIINALKYQKRRAGIDVIDLGMGNPTDVPSPLVIEKLCEAAHDERNH